MLKILLSNDDGVDAPGIASLYNNLVDIAELFVVAPAINQSGAGCSITTNRPLKVKKFKENFISVNGKPSDCVHLGVHELSPWKPDLIISGINLGANMAEDLLYSGTVGAALEGMSMDIPSIAVSAAAFEQPGSVNLMEPNYETAARVMRDIVLGLDLSGIGSSSCLNINVPNITYSEGIKKVNTFPGTWGKRNPPHIKESSKGAIEYWTSHRGNYPINEKNSDIATLERNEISITAIKPNFNFNTEDLLAGWMNI